MLSPVTPGSVLHQDESGTPQVAPPTNSALHWADLYSADPRPTRRPSVGDLFWADRDLRWDADLAYVGRDGNTARP